MAVEGADAAGPGREDVGTLRIADVLLQPQAAEGLLKTVDHQLSSLLLPLLLELLLFSLLVLTLLSSPWGLDGVEVAPYPDDLVPVVVLSLEVPGSLFVDVEGLGEELCVEAGEDVVAISLLFLLSGTSEWLLVLSGTSEWLLAGLALALLVKLILWVTS